jgi:hypothetical protein
LIAKNTTNSTWRLIYYDVIGIGMSFYLHGFGVFWMILMVTVNWMLAKIFAGVRGYPIFAWLGNLGFLLLAEYYSGFTFKSISPSLSRLDRFKGEMKWHTVSNLRMLNIVSFCIDWHWAKTNKPTSNAVGHSKKTDEVPSDVLSYRDRVEAHSDDYSLMSAVAYFFYPFLYLAGPTTTYNAWIS